MTTSIGKESDFRDAVVNIIELDYAAVAAYQEAIKGLKTQEYKNQLKDFKKDHERHIEELSILVKEMGTSPPSGAGIKRIFTQGKVMIANLMHDKEILLAMKMNEDDTNDAYQNINSHPNKTKISENIIQRGMIDEKRHRDWLVKTLEGLE